MVEGSKMKQGDVASVFGRGKERGWEERGGVGRGREGRGGQLGQRCEDFGCALKNYDVIGRTVP